MLRRIASASIFLATFCGLCEAAKKTKGPPPAISRLIPSGGKAGSTFVCSVGGTLAKTENKVWADHAGIVFKPTTKPDVFDVTIAPDVPLGAHLIRFYNDDGASPPRVFVVGGLDEIAEVEPNDDAHKPQQLAKIPVTINGALQKAGDADTFAFHAEAGRWIVLALDGYALGTQMDPAMRLLDEHGTELVMSHDTFNLDPFIAFEVKKTGTYMAQVMAFVHPPAADVTLKGSADHVYRLTITDKPFARGVSPCAVQQGTEPEVKLIGWNLGQNFTEATAHKLAPLDAASDEAQAGALRHMNTLNGATVLAAVVGSPVIAGQGSKEPQALTLPCTVSGRIAAARVEDRYRFAMKKGASIICRVHAQRVHSPLDAVLRIEDATGKVLKEADDDKEGDFDPSITFKAAADGDYTAIITDRFMRGGWDFLYALELAPAAVRLSATLDNNAYKLEAGKTADVKATVKAAGDIKGKLTVRVDGLPPGVTAKAIEVPAKGGEAKLTLTAAVDAASSGQPFTVTVSTTPPDAAFSARATFDLKGVEPRGDRLLNEDSRAWLTLSGKAEPTKPEPAPAAAPADKAAK